MVANRYVRQVETIFKTSGVKEKIKVSCSKEACLLFHDLMNSTQEKLIALHLGNDNMVLCFQVVHIGTMLESHCNPADILRTVLLTGAIGLILLHNHPSGNVTPSPIDRQTLNRMKAACKMFHIYLHDWIIVGGNEYYSASDAGELEELEKGR